MDSTINNNRMALVLSSYKRPESLMRQLFSLMSQTYGNYTIFLSIKGVPEYYFTRMSQAYFEDEINNGRLRIRYDPNKNQVSNFLDPIRSVDLDEYDLFCKIDDDDFYGPGFLEFVNARHQGDNARRSSFMWGQSTALKSKGTSEVQNKCSGGSGCAVQRQVIRDLQVYESLPVQDRRQAMNNLFPRLKLEKSGDKFGKDEDSLMLYISKSYGLFNLWNNLPLDQRDALFMPYRAGASMCRSGSDYLSKKFRAANLVATTDPVNWEYPVCLAVNGSRSTYFLFQSLVYNGAGEVVGEAQSFLPEERIDIQWLSGENKCFSYRDEGIYRPE